MPFIAIALAIAAVIGGGTAAAAQSALPGDALWGFKVYVNESIEGALSASDVAKAQWDIAAIETRLNEAQTLATKGTFSATDKAAIESNFQEHAAGVAHIIARLQTSGDAQQAAEVATQYQAAVAKYAASLADAQARASTDVETVLSPLVTAVRTTLDNASTISAAASVNLSSQKEENQ